VHEIEQEDRKETGSFTRLENDIAKTVTNFVIMFLEKLSAKLTAFGRSTIEDDDNLRSQETEMFKQLLVQMELGRRRTSPCLKEDDGLLDKLICEKSELAAKKRLSEQKCAKLQFDLAQVLKELDKTRNENALDELAFEYSKLSGELDANYEDFAKLRIINEGLEAKNAKLDTELVELGAVRERCQKSEKKLQEMVAQLKESTDALKERQVLEERLQSQVEELNEKVFELEEKMEFIKNEASLHVEELEKAHQDELRRQEQDLHDMMTREVSKYRERYLRESALRRKVHNELMDLKGNLRVFCRVRPSKSREEDDSIAELPKENEIVLRKGDAQRNHFEFDRVFSPGTSQEEVFEDISPLITSVLDGYDVCIFAFGQTGSGKTHTMEGPNDDPGVNFRALQRLFLLQHDRQDDESFSFEVSALEIHNEKVKDLLQSDQEPLRVREKKNGEVFVEDLQTIDVHAINDVKKIMKLANQNRSVGSHKMNSRSSRSHLVLSIQIHCTHMISGQKKSSRLNLIDLAGSERISKTGVAASALEEAKHISTSLTAFGCVMNALAQGNAQHIPFRDSKLTWLLKNSLSGNSKVAMFVNIASEQHNVDESISSLSFASRCRKIQINNKRKKK